MEDHLMTPDEIIESTYEDLDMEEFVDFDVLEELSYQQRLDELSEDVWDEWDPEVQAMLDEGYDPTDHVDWDDEDEDFLY